MMEKISNERKSNIELLRIICMLCLVAHHFSYHGQLYQLDNVFMKDFSLLFCPLGKIFYDVFIVISCWFLVDSKWKSNRFFKIWLEVLFYNITIDFIVISINGFAGIDSLRMLLGGLFPMTGNSHGFASSYLCFIIVLPFLKLIQDKTDIKRIKLLILILAIIQIGSWSIGMLSGFDSGIKSELLLFTMIYFISVYLKQINFVDYFSQTRIRLIGWLIIAMVYAFEYGIWYIGLGSKSKITEYLANFINNQTSPLNILSGFLIFFIVYNISINYSKSINKIATGTFGVLLIHDHNYLRDTLWKGVLTKTNISSQSNITFVLLFFITVVLIFISCVFVDFLRQFLEKAILKNTKVESILKKVDCSFTVTNPKVNQ